MARTSRKYVEMLIAIVNDYTRELGYEYRYICHQYLGDRANYYYKYSLIKLDKDENRAIEILSDVSLKEVAEKLQRYWRAFW